MADIVPAEKRSVMMAGIKGKDTKPELKVRRLLHAAGFRFRLHRKDLPGRPDIVLPRHKAVVFVNGCYWHGHEECALYRLPLTRTQFWAEKIGGNRDRDARNIRDLLSLGWRVIVVWECALKGRNKISEDDLIKTLISEVCSNEKFVKIEHQ